MPITAIIKSLKFYCFKETAVSIIVVVVVTTTIVHFVCAVTCWCLFD
jgi:putative effector of murein hydrolase LrgA (UPF0299 family)